MLLQQRNYLLPSSHHITAQLTRSAWKAETFRRQGMIPSFIYWMFIVHWLGTAPPHVRHVDFVQINVIMCEIVWFYRGRETLLNRRKPVPRTLTRPKHRFTERAKWNEQFSFHIPATANACHSSTAAAACLECAAPIVHLYTVLSLSDHVQPAGAV